MLTPGESTWRYSMYRYEPDHYAVDCEVCNVKVANLKADSDPAHILRQLAAHDERHGGPAVER